MSPFDPVYPRERLSTAGSFCLAVVLLYALIALGASAGWIAADWDRIGESAYASPSAQHWLGTNRNGQDVLARALYGSRAAFTVGLTAALASVLIGVVLGALAGYFGGATDAAISTLAGLFDCIPFYLLALALACAFPGRNWTIPLAMTLSFWTPTARVLRAEVLRLKHQTHVEAARASGLRELDILRQHLLPQCRHLALVQGSLSFVAAIKTEALLSFLGLAATGGVSWGLMLAQAAEEIGAGHFQNFIAATAALSILALAVSLLADEWQLRFDEVRA